MKPICIGFLYALLCSVIFGQPKVEKSKPLSLKIEAVNQKVCLSESFDLKVELLNTSNEDIIVDTNGIGGMRSFSVIRIKNNQVSSSNRTEIGEPGAYYKGKFTLLKPNETYQTIHSISLKDDFFETPDVYRVYIYYRQFLNDSYNEKPVWLGSVSSNKVKFEIEKCQKSGVKK